MLAILERAKAWIGLGPATAASGAGAKTPARPDGPKSTLRENAEKALQMKQAAGPQTTTPEHRTSHEGEIQGGQVGYSDTALGKESTYTSNLKRSHNARSGDGS
jgi:hypothetical protein